MSTASSNNNNTKQPQDLNIDTAVNNPSPNKHPASTSNSAQQNPQSSSNNINTKPKPKSIGHYILGKTIGEGTFGKVKVATHILTGEKVAIKILEKERIVDVADVERVAREIHILKIIRHPNIIQLYEIIETPKQLFLVMEYVNGGELFDYIVAHTRVKEREASKFFQQIISGVEYVHQLNIVHRDMKPENLLLDHKKNIKVVDFGLSNTYKTNELLKTACGSPCYAAPEMIAGKKYQGLAVDIWSCGVILFALICGYLPFEDPNTAMLYKKILNGDYTIPKFVSNEARDLIKNLLNTNSEQRYTMADIKKHSWFNQVKLIREPEGIIIGYHKIPIDYDILKQLENYGFNVEYAQRCLEANKHNHVTTTYYLLLKKYLQMGGKSTADINSENFDRSLLMPAPKMTKALTANNTNENGKPLNGSKELKNKQKLDKSEVNFMNNLNVLKNQKILEAKTKAPLVTSAYREKREGRERKSDRDHENTGNSSMNSNYRKSRQNFISGSESRERSAEAKIILPVLRTSSRDNSTGPSLLIPQSGNDSTPAAKQISRVIQGPKFSSTVNNKSGIHDLQDKLMDTNPSVNSRISRGINIATEIMTPQEIGKRTGEISLNSTTANESINKDIRNNSGSKAHNGYGANEPHPRKIQNINTNIQSPNNDIVNYGKYGNSKMTPISVLNDSMNISFINEPTSVKPRNNFKNILLNSTFNNSFNASFDSSLSKLKAQSNSPTKGTLSVMPKEPYLPKPQNTSTAKIHFGKPNKLRLPSNDSKVQMPLSCISEDGDKVLEIDADRFKLTQPLDISHHSSITATSILGGVNNSHHGNTSNNYNYPLELTNTSLNGTMINPNLNIYPDNTRIKKKIFDIRASDGIDAINSSNLKDQCNIIN